jgi:hypothetical protein
LRKIDSPLKAATQLQTEKAIDVIDFGRVHRADPSFSAAI